MSGMNETGGSEPHSQDSDYDEDVARFLDAIDEPELRRNSGELWDCLWRVLPHAQGDVAVSEQEDWDALQYELARLGASSTDKARLERELKSDLSIQKSLRKGLVELLTELSFSDAYVPSSGPAPFARDLLHGLENAFQKAGESPEAARSQAVSILRDLVRHPERYEDVRDQAGLPAGQDSGLEARSDSTTSGDLSGLPTPVPWNAGEVPTGETPPMIPEDAFFQATDKASMAIGRGASPEAQSPGAGSAVPAKLHEEPSDHDLWHSRSFRYRKDE